METHQYHPHQYHPHQLSHHHHQHSVHSTQYQHEHQGREYNESLPLVRNPSYLASRDAQTKRANAIAAKKNLATQLPLLSVGMNNKLPSLGGILKRMKESYASTSPRDSYYSNSPTNNEYAPRIRYRSPVAPMSSIRSLISPIMSKLASSPSSYPPRYGASDRPFLSDMQPVMVHHPSPAVRKRSWEEYSSESSSYSSPRKIKDHEQPSPATRTRASKYCKVEGCERVSQRNNLCHSHGGKRLCKEEGCSSKDRGNGFCIKHGGGKICSVGNCEKKARRKGRCTQHFRTMGALHQM